MSDITCDDRGARLDSPCTNRGDWRIEPRNESSSVRFACDEHIASFLYFDHQNIVTAVNP